MSNLSKNIKNWIEKKSLSQDNVKDLYEYCAGGHKNNQKVVGIREFVESPHYLNCKDTLYPEILRCLEDLNSGQYFEAVLTGAIGSGKTTLALYTIAYQLYCLSCLINPHREFGLDPSSEIVFIFQSLNAKKSREVDYERFRELIDRAPYFQSYFSYSKDMKSRLEFPKRIFVKPVSGEQSAAIGENVIGGLIDEVNYMDVIEQSKRAVDGGSYDQAESLYHSLARRRESRFMKAGKLPGILCLSSSKRYPGEFTDRKIEEARTDKGIYVFDKRVWEVKPEGTYSEETFKVFIGDATHNPYIIDDDEEDNKISESKILEVPIDFKKQFEKDIFDALREIGGISLRSSHPYLINIDKVLACFEGAKSVINFQSVDFDRQKILIFNERIQNIAEPRYIHIDLGLTHDHAGMVMGHVDKFVTIDRGEGNFEVAPHILIDFVLDIVPPKNGEIDYGRIRSFIYTLKKIGVIVKWISFDGFQSADMIQQLRHAGYDTGVQSVEQKTGPYEYTKSALYDNRIQIPKHKRLYKELTNLELDETKDKIDHPPNGTKDCADALAGVVYGLSIRREIWARHRIDPRDIKKFIEQNRPKEFHA